MIVDPRASIDRPKRWRHQENALDWAIARPASYMHIDMGLGKSRIGIDLADHFDIDRTLVFSTKRGVAHVWPGQYADWSRRKIEVHAMLKGTIVKRIEKATLAIEVAAAAGRPIAIVANWEMLREKKFETWVRTRLFGLVMLDEFHRMKAHNGKTSKACARAICRIPRRIAFSGTPMPHSPLDIWAQYRALDALIFGPRYWNFHNSYAVLGGFTNPRTGKPCQVVGWQNLDDLRTRLATSMFEPDPDTIEVALPSERHVRVEVALSVRARRLYDAVERDIVIALDDGEINPSNALVKLIRLQQLGSGLAVSEEIDDFGETERFEEIVDSAKEEAIAEIIDGTSEHVVVFCLFHAELDAVHRAAESVGRKCAEVSGRKDELTWWDTADGAKVLAVQIQAGSEALDMTRARHCAFMSTGFNMGLYLQALKRIRRPGWEKYAEASLGRELDRPVTYYHIMAKDTVDDRIYATLLKRGDLVRAALEGLRSLAPQL